MRKLGLKLWSKDFIKNPEFSRQGIKAVKDGLFGYLELFALSGSFADAGQMVKEQLRGLPVIIHAPHSCFGVDTGEPELFEENCRKIKDSQLFADVLNAEIIILHAGMEEGEKHIAETVRQFNLIKDKRLAVENLPKVCSSTRRILHGTSPEQIKRIKTETGCKFCLDFSHAICAANSYGRDIWTDLDAYCALSPDMYHLCDGDWKSDVDAHLHYGEGNYDLTALLTRCTKENSLITMETGHGIPDNIEPWLKDRAYLLKLLK